MKSKSATVHQSIIGDDGITPAVGFLFFRREVSSDSLAYYYADGTTSASAFFTNFFQNFNDQ